MQVSKALLAEYATAKRRNKPIKELGLDHMNKSPPAIPSELTDFTLRSAQFQVHVAPNLCVVEKKVSELRLTDIFPQYDVFCLRERDLLNRFVTEVSQYQAQGDSKESASVLVITLSQAHLES